MNARSVQPSITRRSTLRLLSGAAGVGLGVVGLGACGRPQPDVLVIYPVDAPELAMASTDPETGSWQSAPWSGIDWIPYPPRGQIQVEHALGRVPTTVMIYLSFDPDGSTPALAAGDLARVVDVDASTVTVWNDTNGRYFARVVVQ